ncbi:DUF6415 family natural product biosynthesis protein [Streptomyces sp. NPDC058000]|uniref:DUF6415 family natural product biosynthesis protein n=1 Tax=Streptomyces sp. NPDC058000 TaxID=3346299 RepID=UPI0036EEC010
MAAEIVEPSDPISPSHALVRVDVETISETIRRALGLGATRASRDELAETDETLRGHVTLLLSDIRETASRQLHSFETQQLTRRLDRIKQHLAHPFGQGPLTADAEVHQRARDCQWLLAYYTAEARR